MKVSKGSRGSSFQPSSSSPWGRIEQPASAQLTKQGGQASSSPRAAKHPTDLSGEWSHAQSQQAPQQAEDGGSGAALCPDKTVQHLLCLCRNSKGMEYGSRRPWSG